jgi:thioester reductase-like protein
MMNKQRMNMKQVFITGGDGYLGQRIAKYYLQQGEYQVLLWVHANDAEAIEKKLAHLQAIYGQDLERLKIYWGDLVQSDPFEGIDTIYIEHIVHTAAVIAFNVDEQTARQVNVEGTRKLLEFARQCPNLKALGHISSLYASGLSAGSVSESRFMAEQGHANYYEWSKWATEALLFDDYFDLPWRILRVGTIIADDESGHVTQHNAIHNTLKLFYYGLLSIIPGKEQTPLYLATGDYVAAGIYHHMQASARHQVVHLTHARESSIGLAQFVDIAYEQFSGFTPFSSRKIMKPLYADYDSFELLAKSVNDFGGPLVNRALSTVKPFAAQLFIDKDVKVSVPGEAMYASQLPDMDNVIRHTCNYLVQTGFKRERDNAAS